MMRVTITGLLGLTLLCWAETVSDPRPTRALYEASNAAMRGGSTRAALETMEVVAEGKSIDVILAAAQRAGLQAYFTKDLQFRDTDYSVRAFAMEMIGRTGLPEALDYLSAVTPEQLGRDDSRTIYPASKVGLYKALLQRDTDPERQIVFLEAQLTSAPVGQVALWAQEELCDRGSVASIDMIQRFIKGLDSSSRGEEKVAFCRRRVDVVQSNPNRAVALGSVLRADATVGDERILRWAIYQLLALRNDDADAVLDRYATEVAQRFPTVASAGPTPEGDMHVGFVQEIRHAVPNRRRK